MGRNRKNMGKKLAAFCLILTCLFSDTAFGAGWERVDGGGWRYVQEDGSFVHDGFSPDGYYVDSSGIWRENREILGARIPNRNTFLTASQAGSLLSWEERMRAMMKTVGEDCGESRSVTLEDKRITYLGPEDQELFSFYKEEATDGYILRLKCKLSNTRGSKNNTIWYDFQALSAFLAGVCPGGVVVSEAIYSSWEETNSYGLKNGTWIPAGGVLIRYEAVSGAGIYHIKEAGGQ